MSRRRASIFVRAITGCALALILGTPAWIGPASPEALASTELKLDACTYPGSGSTWTATTGPVNATLVGNPSFSSAEGGHFVLNGTTQYITIPDASITRLSTSSARTFQLWMKPTALPASGSTASLLMKYSTSNWDGYYFALRHDGYLNILTNGGARETSSTSTTAALQTNQWYLITLITQITATSNSTKVYVNTQNVISAAHGPDTYSESAVMNIGSSYGSLNFAGRIGALHVYDRALSDSEIATAHTTFSNRTTSGGCVQSIPEVSSFSSSQSSPTNDTSFTYALTFSEAVTGVAANDFTNAGTATGCTFSPGTDTSSTTRTVTVSGCGQGTVRPRFAANGATSASSGTGPTVVADASTVITRDTTEPSFTNGSIAANGRTVTLNFDETLGSTSAPASAYRVTATAVHHTPTAVTVSGSSVQLTLPVTLEGSATATVSYTAPASNNGTSNAALQDVAGNDASSFTGRPLTNNSTADGTAPTATWTPPASPSSSRTITYTLTFSEPVSGISAGDFQNLGTASSCTFAPSSSSTASSITVSVSCGSDGTVIAGLVQNSVVDANTNTGPTSATTASPVTISSSAPTTAPSPTTTTTAPIVAPSTSTAGSTPMTQPTSSTVATRTNVATTVPAAQPSRPLQSPATTTTTSTAVTTTTTIPAATIPATTTTLSPIDIPETDDGGAAAQVGGVPVQASITRQDNQLAVTAGPITARFRALAATGGQIPLDEEGRIRLNGGDSVTVEAQGFDPRSQVEVRLYSDPTLLGRSVVDSAGSLLASYEIPENTPAGDHTVVMIGTHNDEQVTFSLSIAIGKESESLNPLVIVLPLGLAIAGGLLLPVALRRRRQTS